MKQLIWLLAVPTLISCKRNCGDPPMVPPVTFHVVDRLHTIDLNKVHLYWDDHGTLRDESQSLAVVYPSLSGVNPPVADSPRPLFTSSRIMPDANQPDTAIFYLDYGNGQMDTLRLKVITSSREVNHCPTSEFELTGLYSGSSLVRDTFDYRAYPVYLLKRN
jgi:hypothetical protein